MAGTTWRDARRRLYDTLFPPKCAGCGLRGHWLCPACLRRIERLLDPMCGVCRQPIGRSEAPHGCRRRAAPLSTIVAVGYHAGPLREAIHALKYGGRHGIAATLVTLLAPTIAPLLRDRDLLVPVPLHPTRERERGYNQSARLAAELAYLCPIDVEATALRRIRPTAQQTSLTGAQRRTNLQGAFLASPQVVSGRRIWLLDDVYTTGATLHACAQALRAADAGEICGAVIAMAPYTQ